MQKLLRVIRAFFKALSYTIQGKRVLTTAEQYPNLTAWMQTGLTLVEAAYYAAEQAGVGKSEREALRLKIDRRDISAEVILAAVRFHLTTEYPSLLRSQVEHNLTTLYALNLDDQYRVQQLAIIETLPDPVQQAVVALRDHLLNIPSSTEP